MEELRRADYIFENILQEITDSVLLLSKDLKILWANKAFQNQTGYRIEEIIGNYCYRFTHHQETPCKLPYDLCPIAEAKENGKAVSTTHTHFDKEGNKIFVEVSAYPVKDERGEIVHFAYMYRDISGIKRVEEELRNALEESQKRQAEILALLEGSRAILKYHDFHSAARSIFDSCKTLIGATSGYIALLSKDGAQNEVLFLDSGGLPCTVDPTLPMPIRGLRGEAYLNVETVYHNDFHKSEWMKFMPRGHVRLNNVLFAPMVLDGKVVGLLGIANKPGGFTENDARLASAFAELAAIALTQKRAEEALKDSEERYRSLVELSPDAIAVHSEGKYVYVNPSGLKLFGATKPNEIIGKKVLELVHPGYRKIVSERIQLSYEQRIQAPIIESKIVRLDGQPVDVEAMSTPITYMGKPATQLVLRDITERKMAEEALICERKKLINILDSMEDGVYIVNQQYDIEYINPLLEKEFGPVDERKCYEYFHDRNEVCSWCKNQEVFKGKTVRWEWYSTKTNKTYDLIDTPLKNPDGSISKLEIFRDITERKNAEEALRRARDELETQVQERTEELAKAKELLENAFSNIHVLVAHMDKNFNFIRVNKAYAEADERDPEFYIGKNHFALFPNKENEAIFRKAVETGKPVVFYEKPFEYAEHPERGVSYWDWSLQPIKNEKGEIESLVLSLVDRTQHHLAQEGLIKSEKKYRILIEQAAEGIAILDQQLNFIDANSAACQMTGFTREELLSLNAKDLIPEEDFVSIPPKLAQVLSGKTVVDESRLRRKDGTIISIEVSAKMLEDGVVQTITRDITDRKKAEIRDRFITNLLELFAKKASRKEYLDSAVELIHNWSECRCVGIRVVDEKRFIPYESYVGFTKEFMKLENMLSLDTDICACIRVIKGEFESQDIYATTQNGSFCLGNSIKFLNRLTEKEKVRFRGNCIRNGFLSITIIPIRYHDQILGAIHLADEREGMVPLTTIQFLELIAVPLIGEAVYRFNTEEALRRSEASLYEAQGVAHLGNWDWNIQTNQLHWSDEIYRIFGLSPQQFGATYDEFLNSVHPDDRGFVKKAVHEALYENKPYSIDHRIVLPDGTVRVVHEQAEVTFDEDGKPVRMLGTVQDITDRKKAEEELKKSYEQLRNLSAHLQSVREEERTNIAREIHDELGQALTALKIDISMLVTKLYPDHKPLVEKTESMIKKIDETIQSVKRICTELRPAILDHFGLSAAIEWHAGQFERLTGVKSDISFEPKEIIVDQDLSTAVFRILQEALTNVARHAEATDIKVNLRLEDGKIILEVKDNGRGITEKQISDPKSFGLLGIKERANFLGGHVKINGIRNKGTTLTVSIPLRKKEVLDDKNTNS